MWMEDISRAGEIYVDTRIFFCTFSCNVTLYSKINLMKEKKKEKYQITSVFACIMIEDIKSTFHFRLLSVIVKM